LGREGKPEGLREILAGAASLAGASSTLRVGQGKAEAEWHLMPRRTGGFAVALFDAFLKLDGIKGESADAKHKGEIDISSFSWGLSQTGVSGTGGGGGAGKVKVHDISFTKKTDASSPLLFLNCANGAHIKEASFVVRKAGGAQLEYLKIKLTDVLVSSYKPHGMEYGGSPPAAMDDWTLTHAQSQTTGKVGLAQGHTSGKIGLGQGHTSGKIGLGGDEIPTDQFSLNFSKIEFSYQAQGSDGKAQGGPVLAGWDVKANQKV
jgi:type VI secretion system secreted protein Hcp